MVPMTTRGVLAITTFGLGYVRPASGTWGSLPPVLLALGLEAGGLGAVSNPWVYNGVLIAVALFFGAACVLQADRAVAETGTTLFTLAFAFVAFRLLDIVKPWPAHGLQRVPGGWGILLDDLVAGVYALVIVQVCARLTLET
jgi:phosphatidylglycerophosphatase A